MSRKSKQRRNDKRAARRIMREVEERHQALRDAIDRETEWYASPYFVGKTTVDEILKQDADSSARRQFSQATIDRFNHIRQGITLKGDS